MTAQRERDEFMVEATEAGIGLQEARALLRAATTLQRLAVAECNGDWPCDNGERKVKPCSRCEAGYVPSQLQKGGLCPSCRTEDRLRALLPQASFEFNGDPRGAVLRVNEIYVPPSRRY